MTAANGKPKPCVVCSAVMYVIVSKWERKKYCSRVCRGRAMVDHMNAVRPSPKTYASPPPMGGWNRKTPITLTCVQCSRTFTRAGWRKRTVVAGPFCSFVCKSEYWHERISGENSPLWVGGQQTYRGRDWKRIRMIVVNDQNGCCAHCGKYVGDSLPVNHTRPFREFA